MISGQFILFCLFLNLTLAIKYPQYFGETCMEEAHRPFLKAYREWILEYQTQFSNWHPFYIHSNAYNNAYHQTGIEPPECFKFE
ncbi:unnamed protein product, partial [Mesorhabditis spiculigera]